MGTKERRAIEKQLRLNQILDAARTLLLSQGLENISISKISKHAELGVGTIYFYFKNKEEIFVVLQEEGLALFYTLIKKIHNKKIKSDEKLELIATAFYQFSQDHKDYYDIINYFLSSSKEFFEPEIKNKLDMSGHKIFSLIEVVIREGMANKIFKDNTDAKKHSILFFGALHGLLQLKKLERTIFAAENYKAIYDHSIQTLIGGFK